MSAARSARSRSTLGLMAAVVLGFFALRPPGGLPDRVAEAALLPARLLGPLGLPTRAVAAARGSDDLGSNAAAFEAESRLARRLETAIRRSAWPSEVELPGRAVATLGEVDARGGARGRDFVRVRVVDPERVRVGQGVVSGDVFLGRVARVHFREEPPRRPSRLTRILRALRVVPAPPSVPRDAIDVALITGASERIGAVIYPSERDTALGVGPTRLVVGGVVPGAPTVHLAVHTPESRATRSGEVRVLEPEVPGAARLAGSSELRLCDGFLLGSLEELQIARRGALGTDERGIVQEILGVAPPVDFRSGLNQVLVLGRARPTDPPASKLDPAQPATEGIWRSARILNIGDACPWRSTLRINTGARSGAGRGAAVVDGARLLGRVVRADAAGATVGRLSDPGLEIVALASPADRPDAVPLVVGRLVSRGADGDGALLFEWRPTDAERARARAWADALGFTEDALDVRLFTGSGMQRVPRGLLVGSTRIVLTRASADDAPSGDSAPPAAPEPPLDPSAAAPRKHLLRVQGAASVRGDVRVWLGPGSAQRAGGAR